ncbi:MAG: hypothetical protein VX466_02310 [Myxococcota bacterium]|nr:hypothetical protein [Myxococcota bacterium]
MLHRRIIGLLAAGCLIMVSGSASAQQTFKISGAWYQNRGPLIDIPLNGNQAGCALFGANTFRGNSGFPDGAHTPMGDIPGVAALAGLGNVACVGMLNEPAASTLSFGNPNVGAAPTKGGIPARPSAAAVVNAGAAPLSFTVNPNGFGQAVGKQVGAVAVAPTVIQLGSTFTLNGPGDQTTVANDRNFRANAWTLQPGRMGANFSWCPPGTTAMQVGSCTAPAVGGSATYPAMNGLIRYRAGANAFGGTMQMALGGSADVTIILGVPTGGGMLPVAHQPVAGMGFQEQGGQYATAGSAMFGSAPGHAYYVLNFPCTNPLPAQPPGCSQVVTSGPVTTTMALPPGSNLNWGMPWTTGTVTVINTETQNGQPRSTTLTAMGSDSRNALGAGNITLVAGGHSYRIQAVQNFGALDLVNMTMGPYTPALTPSGVGLAGALIALSAGYLLRRRF